MPQLPSGRHVAIDTAPVEVLFDRWLEDDARLQLVNMRSIDDLLPHVRVLELVARPGGETSKVKIAAGSALVPDHIKPFDTGKRLSDWPAGFSEWPTQDREAFGTFIQDRAIAHLKGVLEVIRSRHRQFEKVFIKELEAAWMKAGVHPSQEPGWDDLPDSPHLDEFDALVALGQCATALEAPGGTGPLADSAADRVSGFWAMAIATLPWLPAQLDPMAPTCEVASGLRAGHHLQGLTESERSWWLVQLPIECNNAFNSDQLNAHLERHAPKAWGVIKVIAIGPSRLASDGEAKATAR